MVSEMHFHFAGATEDEHTMTMLTAFDKRLESFHL